VPKANSHALEIRDAAYKTEDIYVRYTAQSSAKFSCLFVIS